MFLRVFWAGSMYPSQNEFGGVFVKFPELHGLENEDSFTNARV